MAKTKTKSRIEGAYNPVVIPPIEQPETPVQIVPEQTIQNNNLIAGRANEPQQPGVSAWYQPPPEEEMGVDADKYTFYKQQQDLADPEKGLPYVYTKLANPDTYESQAERANREKKERTLANLSGLGDGLMALGNAFAVSKGANTTEWKGMSDANMRRRERAEELRKRDQREWTDNSMRVAGLTEQYNNRREQMRLQESEMQSRNKIAEAQNKIRMYEAQARIAKSEVDTYALMQRIENEKKKIDIEEQKAKDTAEYRKQTVALSKIRANNAGRSKATTKSSGTNTSSNVPAKPRAGATSSGSLY